MIYSHRLIQLLSFSFFLLFSYNLFSAQSIEVKFPKGKSGTTMTGNVSLNVPISYRLNVKKGQHFEADLRSSKECKTCYLYILTPSGEEYGPVGSEYDYLSDQFQESGDYIFTVQSKSKKTQKFNLKFKVTN